MYMIQCNTAVDEFDGNRDYQNIKVPSGTVVVTHLFVKKNLSKKLN